jgi:DNA-binding FrmR family transcriptional regulator
MLDEGRDCTELLTQLSAANAALNKAGFGIISVGMQHCAQDAKGNADRAALEKAFLSLA